jgi:tRNA(Ile)-lysidine synthase
MDRTRGAADDGGAERAGVVARARRCRAGRHDLRSVTNASSLPASLDTLVARLVALDDLVQSEHPHPVLVGCSGGADSSALLALSRAAGLRAIAVHVDHGLRPGSASEASAVAALAERFGAGFRSERVVVPAGGDLEARARDVRRAALERVRREAGAVAVLLGHTADDQAETVVLNLLRGGGLAALAGMSARSATLRRPLLGLRRRDTVEVCARLGISPLHDPMNDDDAFRRIWVRRHVLPLLAASADRDVAGVLARQARLAADDRAALDEMARSRLAAAGEPPEAHAMAAAPVAIARRAVRLLVGPPWPAAADVDRVLDVAGGRARRAQLPAGRTVERVGGRLVVVTEPEQPAPEPVLLPVPGTVEIGAWRLEAWVDRAPPVGWPDGRATCVVDADHVGETLVVRTARPGDRLRPLGMSGTRKLADVLASIGVPASLRDRHPVVTRAVADDPAGEPVWVVGYRVDDRARVRRATRRFAWLRACNAKNDSCSDTWCQTESDRSGEAR